MATTLINLLPEARQAKLRAIRQRKLAATLATLVIGVSIGSVVLLGLLVSAQSLTIDGITKDIKARQAGIQRDQDLPAILTVQQNLNSLESLYAGRPHFSQVFGILQPFVPVDATLESMNLDSQGTLTLNGTAKNVTIVDKLVQVLRLANVEIGPNAKKNNTPYFTGVVLSSLGRDSDGSATFTINAKMATEVFSASAK